MTDKEKLKLYESDGIVGSYYALNRTVGEINDVMKKLKIDNQLSGDEEKDKARRKPLIEELVR